VVFSCMFVDLDKQSLACYRFAYIAYCRSVSTSQDLEEGLLVLSLRLI